MEEEKDVNFISIIDYIGEINDGVAVLLSIKVREKIYQLLYWFNRDDNYIMSIDENFLRDYKIKDIYEYKNYKYYPLQILFKTAIFKFFKNKYSSKENG